MSFSGHPRRRVHGPEQGVVREPLRLLLLRPEDDSQDKVLRGGPQTSLQKVLRQASSIFSFITQPGGPSLISKRLFNNQGFGQSFLTVS